MVPSSSNSFLSSIIWSGIVARLTPTPRPKASGATAVDVIIFRKTLFFLFVELEVEPDEKEADELSVWAEFPNECGSASVECLDELESADVPKISWAGTWAARSFGVLENSRSVRPT